MSRETERIVRAAMASWAATFRLCLIIVVVMAAVVTASFFLDPRVFLGMLPR